MLQDDIGNWITEQLTEINEKGAASQMMLFHVNGRGEEVEVYSMKSGTGKWSDVSAMTELFFTIAHRHARGLPGQQTFQLACVFGTDNKPTRFHPFTMPGALLFGPIPGGGLGTESPTPTGQTQQGMRLTEILVQGAFAERKHASEVLSAIVTDLRKALADSQGEVRDLWVALKEVLARLMEAERKAQLEVIAAKRNAMLVQELTRLGPAMVNGVTGRNIFPIDAASTSALRGLNKILDAMPGARDHLASLATQAGPEAQAAYVSIDQQLQEIARQEAEQEKKVKELAGESVGDDYAEAIRDAGGQVIKILRKSARGDAPKNGDAKQLPEKSPIEVAAGPSPATSVDVGDTSASATFGEEFFAAASDSDITSMAMLMRTRGATAAADAMVKGYEVYKQRAAARATPTPAAEPTEKPPEESSE